VDSSYINNGGYQPQFITRMF